MPGLPFTNSKEASATLVLVAGDDHEHSPILQLSEAPDKPVRLDCAGAEVLLALKYHAEHHGSSQPWGDRYSVLTAYQLVFNRTVTRQQIEAGVENLQRSLRRDGLEPNQLLAQNGKTGEYRLRRTLHIHRAEEQ